MNKYARFLKSAAAVLFAAVFALSLASAVPARAAGGFVIDDSVFSRYDIDKMTVWYWREGLPPTTKNGTIYPVLITWDNDTYFFSIDANFFSNERKYSTIRNNVADLPLFHSQSDLNIRYDNGFYPARLMIHGSGDQYWDGGEIHYVDGYIAGYYRYVCSYPASSQALTAKLPFNLTELKKQGRMVSLEKISVPYLVGRGTVSEDKRVLSAYAMGLEVPESLRPGNRYYNSQHKYAWISTLNSWDMADSNNQLYGETIDYFNMCLKPVFTDSLTDFSTVYGQSTEVVEGGLTPYLWYFSDKTSSGAALPEHYYGITNEADLELNFDDDAIPGDPSEFVDMVVREVSFSYFRADWSGSSFRTHGNRNEMPYDESNSRAQFRVFYATPVIMDVLNVSITVENGQVANFDGPILINTNCTITVKEGGTLTISAKSEANGVDLGWVMNNGKIKVEKGGTLYIQKGACLNKYNNKSSNGGGIICEGVMIVDEGAKLCGGGVDGIQLKNGSHVINYGAIISENFTIEKDHTIENRGDKALVLHGKGNGILGSGYGLFTGEVTSSGFPERGTVEETVTDNVDSVANGIYTW